MTTRERRTRELIAAYLGRLATHVQTGLVQGGDDARLLVLGGDCTVAYRRAGGHPSGTTGHADSASPGSMRTATSTRRTRRRRATSGACRSRWPAGAATRPSWLRQRARPSTSSTPALFGGQVLDETESRMLAASGVAQFGSGMLADPAGQAAVAAWSAAVAERIDAWYIAFDLDALDASGGWAVAMPEPDGLVARDGDSRPCGRSRRAVRRSSAFGATAAMPRDDADMGADGRCGRGAGRGGAGRRPRRRRGAT